MSPTFTPTWKDVALCYRKAAGRIEEDAKYGPLSGHEDFVQRERRVAALCRALADVAVRLPKDIALIGKDLITYPVLRALATGTLPLVRPLPDTALAAIAAYLETDLELDPACLPEKLDGDAFSNPHLGWVQPSVRTWVSSAEGQLQCDWEMRLRRAKVTYGERVARSKDALVFIESGGDEVQYALLALLREHPDQLRSGAFEVIPHADRRRWAAAWPLAELRSVDRGVALAVGDAAAVKALGEALATLLAMPEVFLGLLEMAEERQHLLGADAARQASANMRSDRCTETAR